MQRDGWQDPCGPLDVRSRGSTVESPVSAGFVRLAELLGEPAYLSAAELRARRLQGVPFRSLDLLDGAAGFLLFLVRLGQATQRVYLDEAQMVGDLLVRSVRPATDNRPGCYWPALKDNGREANGQALAWCSWHRPCIGRTCGRIRRCTSLLRCTFGNESFSSQMHIDTLRTAGGGERICSMISCECRANVTVQSG